MRVSRAAYIVLFFALIGCGGAPPAPQQASAPNTEAHPAQPTASAESTGKGPDDASTTPAAKAASSEPTTPAPSSKESAGARSSIPFGGFPDLAESPGAVELVAGAKSIQKESWLQARVQIEKAIPVLETSGRLDAVVAAHVLRGRSCAKTGEAPCAEKAFQRAIELWETPGAIDRLRATGSDDAARGEHMARALSAVGEALFTLAEQKRSELDKIRFPEYKGPDTKEDVFRFIETKVADWVNKKIPKVEEAERAYQRILDIAPEAPPRFAVAGSARMAQMWGKFTAEFRAAPIPAGWRASRLEELRGAYYAKLDEASAPIKARATAKYESCRAVAVKMQHQDESSKACDMWLQKMRPQGSSAGGGEPTEPSPRAP